MDILFRNFQNLPKLPKLPKLPVTCTSFSALTLQSYHKLPQLLKLPITLISLFPASTIQRSHPQWRKLPRLPVTSTFFFGKSFGTYRATTERAWIKPSLCQKSSRQVRIRHGTYQPGLSLISYLYLFNPSGSWDLARSVALFVEGHCGSPCWPEVTLTSTARN